MRPFYLQLRDTTDYNWTPKLQQKIDKVKRNLQTEHLLQSLIQKNLFLLYVEPLSMASKLHFSKKLVWENGISVSKLPSIFHHRT